MLAEFMTASLVLGVRLKFVQSRRGTIPMGLATE